MNCGEYVVKCCKSLPACALALMHCNTVGPAAFWLYDLCWKASARAAVEVSRWMWKCSPCCSRTAKLLDHGALGCQSPNSWHCIFFFNIDHDVYQSFWRFLCRTLSWCGDCVWGQRNRITRDLQQRQLQALLSSHKSTKLNQSGTFNTERKRQSYKKLRWLPFTAAKGSWKLETELMMNN